MEARKRVLQRTRTGSRVARPEIPQPNRMWDCRGVCIRRQIRLLRDRPRCRQLGRSVVTLAAAAAVRIEAAERTTSSSVVAHEEIEIRIADISCQRVPPTQQVLSD